MSPNWPIITELQKQYEVVQVNPSQPIPLQKAATKPGEKDEGFDVLLAVQPSAMGRPEMDNFLAADPQRPADGDLRGPVHLLRPRGAGHVAAPPSARPMMRHVQRASRWPRATSSPCGGCWASTSAATSGRDEFLPFAGGDEEGRGGADQIVWQHYNPYPQAQRHPAEFVFVDNGCGAKSPSARTTRSARSFSTCSSPRRATSRSATPRSSTDRTFVPLVAPGTNSGTIRLSEMILRTPFGADAQSRSAARCRATAREYVPGRAHHRPAAGPSRPRRQAQGRQGQARGQGTPKPETNVNVVLVADIDMLTEEFFRWREQGEVPGLGLHFDFDNVTLVLNALDSLAGDQRFLELRKRRPQHRTLTRIDERTEEARTQRQPEDREQLRRDRGDEATRNGAARSSTRRSKKLTEQLQEGGHRPGRGRPPAGDRPERRPAPAEGQEGRSSSSRAERGDRETSTTRRTPRSAGCRIGTRCGPCCCRPSAADAWPGVVFFIRRAERARGRFPKPIAIGPLGLERATSAFPR